jgi:hypothetical protein
LDKEIYINQPLSSHKIMEILDKHPDLEKIKCPPSIYQRISPKYLDVLSKLGVKVEAIKKTGRPRKYKESDIKNIQKKVKEGYTFQEISTDLNIPLKTVYYINNTPLKRGRKPKYSSDTIKKVNELYNKGLSAQNISDELKIPLRTVYSLLKK